MTHVTTFSSRRRVLGTLAAAAAALAVPQGVLRAQPGDYRGPVRLLVGYPPGGPADTAARIVADRLTAQLGQPVVVDNRPGAGGQLAAQALKAAPADGSVLFMSNIHTLATLPLTVKAPGFSPMSDFRAVGAVATFELALAVHPKTGARTLAELGQWFTAHPAQANIGVPASASAPEFLGAQVSKAFHADAVPIAYKGAAPLVQDLLGGQVAAAVSGVSDFLPYHQSGRLRMVAATRATPLLPGVPSFADAGFPGLELTDFLGLYAPAALADATVARYNAALNRVLTQPEVVERLQAQVMTAVPGTPAEQAERLRQASRLMAALVQATGFKPQ